MFRGKWRGVTPARLGQVLGHVAALLALLVVLVAFLACVTLTMGR